MGGRTAQQRPRAQGGCVWPNMWPWVSDGLWVVSSRAHTRHSRVKHASAALVIGGMPSIFV